MICDKTKECVEKTCHIVPVKKKKGGKGKKAPDAKAITEDIYKQPLSMPPCGDTKRQEECIVFFR